MADKITGRVPPQDLEAEKSIIGAILIDRDAIIAIAQVVKPEHFYKEAHSDIFSAMFALYENREPIDLITLTAQLKKKGVFDKVGGAAYLAELASAVPTAANITQYAQIIRDHFIKRQLISTSSKSSQLAFDETADIRSILDEVEQAVFALSQEHLRQNFIPLKDALAESFDRLDELHKKPGGLRGITTGYDDLDSKLAGMQDSNLLILASRPGQVKTSLALNIAAQVAAGAEHMTFGDPDFFNGPTHARRIVEALDDVFPVLQPALADPAGAVAEEVTEPVGVVENDEPLDEGAVDQQRPEVRPRRGRRGVVLGDEAAERDPRVLVDEPKNRGEHTTPDVFKIDVDTSGTGLLQGLDEILGLVVHAGIEAQLLHDMLICANSTRPYFRDLGVAYGWKAHIYSACSRCPLKIIHRAKCQSKSKDSVLVIL